MGKELMKRSSTSVHKLFLIRILGILLVGGLPVVFFLYAFSIKNITVQGAVRYTPMEIEKKIIQTKPEFNSIILYLKYKYFAHPQIPFIEDISVDLMDNHSVNITVYEKSITGCVEFLEEYLYFDKDGIIVESTSKRLKDVPLIKGLQYSEIVLHKKLKVQEIELFDVIMNLTQLIKKFDLDVDTITFDSKYEVTVECGSNTVLLGKRGTYDELLSNLKNILANEQVKDLLIDLRRGTDSFIAKSKN
jgi:cell division protein FtsQ